MTGLDDQELVARCRQELPYRQDSFELLVERHQHKVYTLCLRMTSSPEDGDDLTQEVFTKVFFKLKHFEGRSAFSSWLYRIAYNHCLNFLDKRRRARTGMAQYSQHELTVGDQSEPPSTSRLRLTLDEMDPEPRAVLILKYVLGMDLDEISQVLGVSVGAVKMRLLRARNQFERLFKE